MLRLTGQIDVIAVGKMKTRYWTAAQNEYLKRLGRYGRFQLTELKDAVGRGLPDEAAKQKEGDDLLKAAADAHRLILLDPTGKKLSSQQLARFLQKQNADYGRIAFLIGGPIGFAQPVISAAHAAISLSPLTFTHEMARVILLEQLYRACTILNNEPYHK